MRGSSSSDVTASQGTAAEVCITGAPRVLTGRDWPCHQGLKRRGHLRTCSGLAQDHRYFSTWHTTPGPAALDRRDRLNISLRCCHSPGPRPEEMNVHRSPTATATATVAAVSTLRQL